MKASIEKYHPRIEEILEILKLDHAHLVEIGEAEVVEVGFDTSVHDWFWLGDDLSRIWVSNANRLNGLFEMDVSIREWKTILTPPRKKTVRDICEFVAERSTVVRIPQLSILGRQCRPASAFLTLKKMLGDTGADTSNLMPSSPLADFTETGLPKIYLTLIRTAPELIKRIGLQYRSDGVHIALAVVLLLATIPLGVAAIGSSVLFLPLALMSLGGFIYVWHLSERHTRYPLRVEFEGMKDFRDLSYALARKPPKASNC